MSELEKKIQSAINSVSPENASNTPDFILANFLMNALAALDTAIQQRDKWYGRALAPGGQNAAPQVTGREQSRATGDGQPDVSSAGPAVAAPDRHKNMEPCKGMNCKASAVDGILCAENECDYASGVRKPPRMKITGYENGRFIRTPVSDAALRAAPSLSKEEAAMIEKMILDSGVFLGPISAKRDKWAALRAKVRSLSHPEPATDATERDSNADG